MKKSLLIGVMFMIVMLVFTYVNDSTEKLSAYLFNLSTLLLLLGLVFSGFSVGGDRLRLNLHSEEKEDRYRKLSWSRNFMITALPSLIMSFIISKI